MKVLVTGAAGFIGFHTTRQLAERGEEVVALDNLNAYYDTRLKLGRLEALGIDPREAAGATGDGEPLASTRYPGLRFFRRDITDSPGMKNLLASERFDCICHLAAQAGVRYSLENPAAYISSNIEGFLSVLEAVRQTPVDHLVYASSSSVYGADSPAPYSETAAADHPVSLYAATKRSNELMAYTYAHLYGVPSTGLRFFTVYGPWGRPDMAPTLFADAIAKGNPIKIYNHGEMQRDFTYVDDVVEGIIRVLSLGFANSAVAHRIYNIGNGAPVRLMDFISALENEFGTRAEKDLLPMQRGDVTMTWADCTALHRDTGYAPRTAIETGVTSFVNWYRSYYLGSG